MRSPCVFLQDGGTSVSQTLTGLVLGETYQLSFVSTARSYEGRYDGTPGVPVTGLVSISNSTLAAGVPAPGTDGITEPGPDFMLTTMDFTATATGNSVITLANTSAPNNDETEDFSDVTITPLGVIPTPEPSTYAMIGFGALALVLARRRLAPRN